MNILFNVMWTLIFLTMINKVKGYANGNVPQSCQNMLVVHDSRGGQTAPLPFEVVYSYSGPDLYTVTLRSKGSMPFTGFMLEARRTNDSRPMGKFIILKNTEARLLNCDELMGSAVTQKRNTDKTLLSVNWTSEGESVDVFRATFVQTFAIFWDPVDFPITPPTEPTTTEITTKPTTQPTEPTTTEITTKPTTQPTEPNTTASTTRAPRVTWQKQSTPQVTSAVLMLSLVLTVPSTFPNNAKYHSISKWTRRICCTFAFILELSALVVVWVRDSLNLTLIALGFVMTVIGLIELVIVCLDIGRSHELKNLYDGVIDALALIQKAFAIAFIFVATKHCKSLLRYVLISFTAWIVLNITYIVIVKVLKIADATSTIGVDNMKKTQKNVTVLIVTSSVFTVGTAGFCIAIIVEISQC